MHFRTMAAAAALTLALPAQAATFTYTGDGGAIRDFTNTRSTITITDAYAIGDLNVFVDGLTHSFPADVQLFLENGATSVRLIENNGPGRNGAFGATLGFDDQAATSITGYQSGDTGPYRPIDALSTFNGRSIAGNWTLRAYDSQGGDNGGFTGWRLQASEVAAVPEPATWSLMLLGFGGAGSAMRRRPRVAIRLA